MKVACCGPDINLRSTGTRFGSQEALVFLKKCNNFRQLKEIHARIIRFGLTHDQSLTRKLLKLSSSYAKLSHATMIFDQLNDPDTPTWNVMLRLCSLSDSPEHALLLFKAMLCQGFAPDKFTYPFVINACRASSALGFGRVAHALAIKMGFWGDLYVQNTAVNLYFDFRNVDDGRKVFDKMLVRNVFSWNIAIAGLAEAGKLDTARELFEEMPSKNVVSWTAMIDGCVKHKQPVEAFKFFQRMQVDNVGPNEYTVVSLIRACSEMGSLKLGRCIHHFALKNGLELRPFLGTALIDMYSKCGSLVDARRVFGMMQVRTLATWNTMITSLGVHGLWNEALAIFGEMEKAEQVPDAITFVGVLSACIHKKNLEQGQKYFNLMTDCYGITPIVEHYKCMDELYSRANKLEETCALGKTRLSMC
ncbi:Pentatricopeptide repeat-containing protein [Spatholobus suberectus]|nr:Pentatricopeptide repeat-containing protein [Spatholobus suberectus]